MAARALVPCRRDTGFGRPRGHIAVQGPGAGPAGRTTEGACRMAIDPSSQITWIPAPAQWRLDQANRRVATSDFSVDEFLLARAAGFEPLGFVCGTSVFHVGYQRGALNQNMEMQTLTAARFQARQLSMARLVAEAQMLDADGVVDARWHIRFHDWGESTGEFMAFGTAVKHADGRRYRLDNGQPFTCWLPAQSVYKLV